MIDEDYIDPRAEAAEPDGDPYEEQKIREAEDNV